MPQFNFKTLLDYLNSPAWEQRRDAAEDLGAFGDPKAIASLKNTLQDPVGAVQYASVVALGQIGTAAAVRPLLECLNTAGFRFPAAVLEALGNLRVKEAIPHLIRHLQSPDPHLRAIANTSLMVTTGGKAMGFRANADEAHRNAAVQKWQRWWEQNRDTFKVPVRRAAKKRKSR